MFVNIRNFGQVTLATLTNYITVWWVSKKAEGIDVALIKGGCSLLTLSFFNTQQFNIVKPKKIIIYNSYCFTFNSIDSLIVLLIVEMTQVMM